MSLELQRKLCDELRYDPETGAFFRAVDGPVRKAGERVGHTNKALGYVTVNWNGGNKYAHRLAWLYVHGVLPATIDHINGDRADNRLSNLRAAEQHENLQNQSIKPKGGNKLLGASFDKRTGRYFAYIGHKGKNRHLGRFPTAEEAHQAYLSAKRALHTFNPAPREAMQ